MSQWRFYFKRSIKKHKKHINFLNKLLNLNHLSEFIRLENKKILKNWFLTLNFDREYQSYDHFSLLDID